MNNNLFKKPPVIYFFLPFAGIETSEPNAVVIGLAPDHFNYSTLNKAFRC